MGKADPQLIARDVDQGPSPWGNRHARLDLFSIEKRPAFKIDRPEIEPAVLLVEGGVKQAGLVCLELDMGPGMSSDAAPPPQRIHRHIPDFTPVPQTADLYIPLAPACPPPPPP